jgi:hypothetical protein
MGAASSVPIRAGRRRGGLPGLRNAQPPGEAMAAGSEAEAIATSPDAAGPHTLGEPDGASSPPGAQATIAPGGADPSSATDAAAQAQPTPEAREHSGLHDDATVVPADAEPARPRPRTRTSGREPVRTARRAIDVVALDGARTSQLNFYTFEPLRKHIARLAFELQQDGVKTSQSEIFNALLALGPADVRAAHDLIREYRTRTGYRR